MRFDDISLQSSALKPLPKGCVRRSAHRSFGAAPLLRGLPDCQLWLMPGVGLRVALNLKELLFCLLGLKTLLHKALGLL